MQIIDTSIRELSPTKRLVTLVLADSDDLETALESIVLTAEVETGDTPYLKEVQREALETARHALDLEIQATKTVPRPAV